MSSPPGRSTDPTRPTEFLDVTEGLLLILKKLAKKNYLQII